MDETAYVVGEYTKFKSVWGVYSDQTQKFHFINNCHAITEF